jgi:hypothetical protein
MEKPLMYKVQTMQIVKEKERKKASKLILATENDIIINYDSKTMTKRMVIN